MFWADKIANDLKEKAPQHVDDMKTPSGRIHVGSLRGVVIHDLAYKALKDAGNDAIYTYVFDNHDPMDALPFYLPKEEFEKYLGMPLFKVPSPVKGYKNFAEYYALEFKNVFNAIGCNPEIIWATDLYMSGAMNDLIKLCLDKVDVIRGIYEELYKKEMPKNWYPFQVYCPSCGKVSTTSVYDWDGKEVSFVCEENKVKWTKGCEFKGKVSPFSDKNHMAGKLPWKIEWPCKWKVIEVTIEGAGKDHMSKGGSHDLASLVCKKVINYPIPYPIAYEWFLIRGQKMSTSKGIGSYASEMLEILPPEILRFLMVKTDINQAINFDPAGNTIPKLFDEYQEYADHYFNNTGDDYARIFELSQVDSIKKPPTVRFSVLAQWIQMPNMEKTIKKENLSEWAKYAKVWMERFAPESEKFTVKKEVPQEAKNLSCKQKKYLEKILKEIDKEWDPEEFQKSLYEWSKELELSPKDAFSAIYTALIGKDHGPKASWLILSLDKNFVKKRFSEILKGGEKLNARNIDLKDEVQKLDNKNIFSIDEKLKAKFPSISIGIAVIKNVAVKKEDEKLKKEIEELVSSLDTLTNEKIGEYLEIKSYRKLYKEMGIDWHSRRPSPEALLRRIALKKGLYTVNTVVDASNIVVIKNRISVGVFDLDKIEFPTVLRFPKNGEEILLLGDEKPTLYKESEIAYFDKNGGFNIDFNYRDSQKTAVQVETNNLYINVDGIYDITPKQVEKVLRQTCDKIIEYCGGKLELFGVVS